MKDLITFQTFGQHAILISWPSDLVFSHQMVENLNRIKQRFPEEVIETVPTYNSAAIYLTSKVNAKLFISKLKKEFLKISEIKRENSRCVFTIPVCYDEEFGLDLKVVAERNELSIAELIERHTKPEYRVEFLGFLPGFPYLSGLEKRLHTPRKKIPRLLISKGAVGIGGSQTGIYPIESPGGWNIIGRTPIRLFDPELTVPGLLRACDYLKFESVTKTQYELIVLQVASGTFHINKAVYHD